MLAEVDFAALKHFWEVDWMSLNGKGQLDTSLLCDEPTHSKRAGTGTGTGACTLHSHATGNA